MLSMVVRSPAGRGVKSLASICGQTVSRTRRSCALRDAAAESDVTALRFQRQDRT